MTRIAPILIVVALAHAVLPAQAPSPAAQHADKAAEFVQRGDLKNAEAELRKAVDLSPADPALLTSLGGVLGMRGDLRQANVYLSKAVKLKPQDPLLVRNLAANEWQLGRLREAREHLERLVRANPRDKTAIFLLGMVCENQKDYARSIALIETIPDVTEQRPEALVALASSYYHRNRRGDAESALKRLLGRNANPQIVFTGGRVAMDARDYALAEELLTAVRSTYSDPAAASELALAQYRQGRAADSEKTLMETVQTGHANREAYLLLCKVLADRKAYTRALEIAAEAARTFPDSGEVLSTKGAVEMKLEYYSAAAGTLKKAAAMHPSSETRRELAVAEWRAGDRRQAISEFEDAIRQFPRDARTCEVYGTLLLEDALPENRARAAAVLKQAIAVDDSSVEARYQLANLALEDGNPQAALEHLEKAVRAEPDDSRLHFTLSRVYRRLGRNSDADREMDNYRRLKKQ